MVRAYNFRYNNDGSKSALPDYINYRDPAGELMCGDNCFYDESGRLIEIRDSATVNRTDVTPVTVATYGYDRQGQLTAATVGGTSYTYTYDTAGNIQSKQIGGTTTNYTYGNGAWRDLLTAYDGHEISYDGCGNPTRYYDGSAFTWTQGRRLATATIGGTSISYTYDMAGVRSSKTVNGTEYKYTTLSGLVTRQTGGGKTIDFIYDDSNQPLAMKYNGTLYYYILNAQGDVIRIIDGSRSTVASYTYDPWGNIISSSGALAEVNPLRYRGYYYDSETGFYYVSSRYYDPEIGRWINADSQLNAKDGILGYNLFAYCNNNPIMYSDPSGHSIILACIIVGAVIGGLAGGHIAAKVSKAQTGKVNGWAVAGGIVGGGVLGGLAGWGIGAAITAIGAAATGATGTAAAPIVEKTAEKASTALQTYYPPNNGFSGAIEKISLDVGTIIQRTGDLAGRFTAPAGTPSQMLSLPYDKIGQATTYLQTTQPIQALRGTVAPWFGQIGGGTQYLLLDGRVDQLLADGILKIFGE